MIENIWEKGYNIETGLTKTCNRRRHLLMIKKQKIGLLILVLALFGMLGSGCGSSYIDVSKLNESSLVIQKDGTVDEVIIENFDQEYYNQASLESYIKDAVNTYNNAHPIAADTKAKEENAEAITVNKVVMNGTKARVELKYWEASYFSDFNYLELTLKKADALTSEEKVLTMLSAEDKSAVDLNSVDKLGDYNALVFQTARQIIVPDKILYMSDNVTLVDKTTAKTGDGLSVIIYK